MTSRLITIPFSHFCEKARWALDRCAVPFEEDAHLPPFHFGATSLAGSRSTPLLVVDGGPTLTDSTDILEWADGQDPQGGTLFAIPEARELEAYFDDVLGIHARRVSYGCQASSGTNPFATRRTDPLSGLNGLRGLRSGLLQQAAAPLGA